MLDDESGAGVDIENSNDLPAHDLNRSGPAIDLYQQKSSDPESNTSELEWTYDDDDNEKSRRMIPLNSDDDSGMGFLYQSDDNLHEPDLNQCGPPIEYY